MRAWIMLLLLLATTRALAVEPYTCRNGLFPSFEGVRAGEIAPGHDRVHFRNDDKGCPENASCVEKAYLVPGNKVLMAQATDGWACVWYFGQRQEFVGWLPADAVRALPETLPQLSDWVGTWLPSAGDDRIEIKLAADGKLRVSGKAYWQGGPDGDVVHEGGIDGTATPNGNRLTVAEDTNADDCVAKFQWVDGNLVVSDNHNCGGVNVNFDDVYRRAR